MPKIIGIKLENFQTIEKRVTIPIKPLTLLFGPNAAGKSSIFDAIELVGVLFSDNWGGGSSKLVELLERWSRNTNMPRTLGIGVQFEFEKNYSPFMHSLVDGKNSKQLNKIHLASIDSDYRELFQGKAFEIFIGFQEIRLGNDWHINKIEIKDSQGIIIESEIEDEVDLINIKLNERDWLRRIDKSDYQASSTSKSENKADKSSFRLTYNILSQSLSERTPNEWFSDPNADEEFYISENSQIFYAADDLVQQIINFIKLIIFDSLVKNDRSNLPVVSGSRTIPSPEELIFITNGEPIKSGKNLIRPELIKNDQIYKTIESEINGPSMLWGHLAQVASNKRENSETTSYEYWYDLSELGKINSLLTEELFIEQGFQLAKSTKCLIDAEEVDDYDISAPERYTKIIRFYLTSSTNKVVEINDVGSGIGYALPVLISLTHPGISLIQQPELHLHPAMQSAMGTSIVKCIENKQLFQAFTIVETHSEHILLRVMKLIGKAEDRGEENISPLNYSDVAILYFEPSVAGPTKIKNIRLSPDGKLVDRWPGGFFQERFKDIFDE